nr:hypothetical protein [uncultured Sphingomonas sp.]
MSEILQIADGQPGQERDREFLLYDYSKHLLSLALLAIGGVITIAQSPLGKSVPPVAVAGLLLAFAVSGVLALSASSAILQARQEHKSLGNAAWYYIRGSMGLLGIGVGAFLMSWLQLLL